MYNILVILIIIICYLRYALCLSRVFYKAWVKWRYSLIPVVNLYYYCKVSWKTKCFWIPFYLFLAWFAVCVCYILLFYLDSFYDKWLLYKEYAIWMNDFFVSHWFFFYQLIWFLYCVLLFAFLISVIISILKVNICLSKKFKHSVLFWIFLAILNPVFLFFLAFDKSKYNKKLK